jgi:hypothetical protein
MANLKPEQLSILNDLAEGIDLNTLSEKHQIDRKQLYDWLSQDDFNSEYVHRLNMSTQARLNTLIGYVDSAIKELGQLLHDERPEIKLKAIELILKHSDRIEKINLNHRLNLLLSR